MRHQTPASIGWIVGLILLCAKSTLADDVATRWESAYQATDATGPQVLGLWKFDDSDGVDATGRLPKGTLQNGKWVAEGKLKVQEDVIEGLENTPAALIGLLAGENRGKRMVRV